MANHETVPVSGEYHVVGNDKIDYDITHFEDGTTIVRHDYEIENSATPGETIGLHTKEIIDNKGKVTESDSYDYVKY